MWGIEVLDGLGQWVLGLGILIEIGYVMGNNGFGVGEMKAKIQNRKYIIYQI